MDQCKFCQAELEEGSTLCPICGKDQKLPEEQAEACDVQQTAPDAAEIPAAVPTEPVPEPTAQTAPKYAVQPATPAWKVALVVAVLVVLAAALIAMVVTGMSGKKETDTAAEPAIAETAALETGAEETEATVAEQTEATVPPDGDPDDVTCKGSYSVSDEEVAARRDTVVATVGDRTLSNGQLQIYYWTQVQSFLNSYGSYANYYLGLDFSQPLDTQKSVEESGITWQQYFLDGALQYWQQMCALSAKAEEAGIPLTDEQQTDLDQMETTLGEMAAGYDMSPEELLAGYFGPGVTLEDYRQYEEQYCRGLNYFDAQTADLVPTEEELQAYFEAHKDEYASGGVDGESLFVDVRHILVTVKGGTVDESGSTTYSDDDWAACEAEAQAILDQWLAGEQTEDSFAALATEKTEDPGSQQTGGLYNKVYEGQMVQAFNDWCFDPARAYGDYGLVRTEYGCHVMFFVGSEPQWHYYAESDWTQEQGSKVIEAAIADYPMTVDYSKIALGVVALG